MDIRNKITLLLIFLIIFILSLILGIIPTIQSLELKTIDWRFKYRGSESVEDLPVVLVTIDDQSFESLPERWPWPREYYARVIENLNIAGARVIGIDVILDTEDIHGRESDLQLAEVIKRWGNVVLAGKLEERISLGQIQSYQFPVTPIPLLLEADSSWGITAIQADPDGMHRRYFVVQNFENGLLPSFGLQILRKYFDLNDSQKPKIVDNRLEIGDLTIPLLEDGLMMINFAGPAGTFPQYPFDSVIDDTTFDLKGDYDLDYFTTTLLPENVFKDKIVLIGSTVAELHDNFPTPFFEFKDQQGKYQSVNMPGVEIHANAIRTILDQNYFKKIANFFNLVLIFVLIAATYTIAQKTPTLWSAVIIVSLIILYNFIQFIVFSQSRLIMAMVIPTIAIGLSFVASNLHQYLLSQREKKMIVGAFERFVPQKVVKQLLADPGKLTLGGEERFLTVLFMDLADFTSVSEKLKANELVNLVNAYLTAMTEIILKYDGIIDKYEGDAIMAEFGAPVFYDHHAQNACSAALEMVKRLKQIDLTNYKHVVSRLSCRVGINSGNMIVGNMGSRNVFDYTVMGDAVNLASRLEGANKPFGTQIMISYDTYQLVKDQFWARPLDLIRVKGRQKPVRVFELMAIKDDSFSEELKHMVRIFINGIKYYRQGQWTEAIQCFNYCIKIIPNDGPSRLYLERCTQYTKYPPEENWDGVSTLGSK
jgi:adenylate cyclase